MGRLSDNLIGKKFGELTVIANSNNNYDGNGKCVPRVICRCSCGNVCEVIKSSLKNGHTKSCGCQKNKIKNIVGKRFGRLVVIKRCDNIEKCICQCDCGNVKEFFVSNITSGKTKSCGCLMSEETSKRVQVDLSGQRFGRLIVVKRYGEKWECVCDCGNIVYVRPDSLTSGNTKSCGCYKSEKTSKLLSSNLCGQIFGKLKVVKRIGTKVDSDGRQSSLWLCQCECGMTKEVSAHDLKSGKISSCGCIVSKGEYEISKILFNKNIKYKKQYTFLDLKSSKGRCLRFDFAVFDDDKLIFLIEYQGIQHFLDRNWFGKQQREVTDSLKQEYCKSNNIKLYQIKFDEDIEQKINEILIEHNIA